MSLHVRLSEAMLMFTVNTICAAQGVHVCIGEDRIVREAREDECRSNEKSYRLAEEESEDESPDESPDEQEKEPRDWQRELKKLSERVASLERSAVGGESRAAAQRVTAPFEVVDGGGQVILRVQDVESSGRRGLHVFGKGGSLAAQVAVNGQGEGGGRLFAYPAGVVPGGGASGYAALTYMDDGPVLALADARMRPELTYDKKALTLWGEGNVKRFSADQKGVISRGRLSVVDNRGAQIVEISEGSTSAARGLAVHNERNQVAVKLGAYAAGGKVSALGQTPNQFVSIAWEDGGANLRMTSSGGKRLASVSREGLQLYSEQDQMFASISEDSASNAGALILSRSDGTKHAAVDAKGASFYNEQQKAVARLGAVEGEGGNLLIGSPAGEQTIELFHSKTPTLNLKRPGGGSVATLGAHGFHLYNRAGGGIASLAAGPGDAGIFQLFNSSGGTSIEAGTLDDGAGIVRAGPRYRCAAAPAMPTLSAAGLPDCIKGRVQ